MFKTRWFTPPRDWWRPDLKEPFELAMGVRDTFYSAIGSENPVEFDVVVCGKAAVFDVIKVRNL